MRLTLGVRRYRPDDADGTWRTFEQAISRTARAYCTAAQIAAWNPGSVELRAWNVRRAAAWTVVAECNGEVAGFCDLTADGVLDMLFVHPDFGERGVARKLVAAVRGEARSGALDEVRTHASRVARPAFERFGFVVDRENTENWIRGQRVPNFDMHIVLPSSARRWLRPSAWDEQPLIAEPVAQVPICAMSARSSSTLP